MPYQTGSGPSLRDVWHSPNVYANFKEIALWLEAAPSPAVGAPEAVQVSLSLTQTEAVATSAAQADSASEAEVGLAGKGEVPHEGPLEKTTKSDSKGAYVSDPQGFPAKLDPNADPSQIFSVLAKNIDASLSEAASGRWKENGSNPNILGCYRSQGQNLSNDQTPWCAAYAGSVMKASGVQSLKTLSSLAYKGFGTVVPLGDKTKWRLNDIIIFSRKGGGHIGFFRGYNPNTGSILIAGGNQSDNLKETSFKGTGDMPVVSVSRAWTVPAAYDKPVTYSGTAGGSVKVV